jgi:metal-responsive CopG/Arc/MetJ family transcriptional regulator
MKRTQIYIPEHLQKKLETLSKRRGSSKSAIIRDAVFQYIEHQSGEERTEIMRRSAGIWKNKKDIPDISKLRREIDRTL